MQKFKIEMVVPDDVDPSDLLERAQELATTLCCEFAPEGFDGEQVEPDQEAVENEVSVEPVTSFNAQQSAFQTKMIYPSL